MLASKLFIRSCLPLLAVNRLPVSIGCIASSTSNSSPLCLNLNDSKSKSSMSSYAVVQRGALNTPEYRLFFKEEGSGKIISPFHDIPLL